MTETAMPTDLSHGKVIGRFILALSDGPDADLLPDAKAASGKISITSVNPIIKALTPDPTTVVRSTYVFNLDAHGWLVDDQGNRGIWLISGFYKVAYSLQGVSLPAHTIEITSEHTDATPLDLYFEISNTGSYPSKSEYALLTEQIANLQLDGVEGVEGASAYEVAVTNGFVGTEAEWLASLVGPAGTDGVDGADGEKGDTGDQGIPGTDGVDGVDGEKGDTGDQGIPGTDGVGIPQTLSLVGSKLTLSDGGGFITLPAGEGGAALSAIGIARSAATEGSPYSSSSWAPIPLAIASVEVGGAVLSSNGISVPVSGWYSVSARVTVKGGRGGDLARCAIDASVGALSWDNPTSSWYLLPPSGGYQTTLVHLITLYAAAGEIVRVGCQSPESALPLSAVVLNVRLEVPDA